MKIHLILTSLLFTACLAVASPAPVHVTLPPEPGLSLNTDIPWEQHPMSALLRDHPKTSSFVPFQKERQAGGTIPDHTFSYLETTLPAHDVYLFYKRLPYGKKNTSRSFFHFDIQGEKDAPTGQPTDDAVRAYKVLLSDGGKKTLEIIIVQPTPESKTHVLFIEYPPQP